ncbi:MAG: Asp-tRNA(Asn)/Glu-tRNA(Gln) amidotransferase subunit GatB [Clostridia bacterium]|nr:Asp-tRNA(Asn)/Glu-tRNA(Gln) amidotransferase subunit GatB [Clostridia bacterium]
MRQYEMIAGLETHVELSTKTKIFCGCTTAFGSEPNTHCCPVCTGMPGTLPKLNARVVEYAVRAGLATGCRINRISKMDRKNYVYPDLPKAYQISQYDKPLCEWGRIELSNGRTIRITRIHIEEDAGKLVHVRGNTLVDYNRGGVPLIEIVTEPDFRSADEIREYLETLQLTMKTIGVSDCKMQEGSLRCDVNISVRPVGSETFGTRTEIKNMNSFTYMEKAVAYETERQIDLIESGGTVVQETRRYDEASGMTESMRGKEDADDYRYFREPDLVTIAVTDEQIEQWQADMPELPRHRLDRYTNQLQLPAADAALLVKYPRIAAYFDEAAQGVNARTVANFILGALFRRLPTDAEKENAAFPVPAAYLHDLAALIDGGKLNMNLAKTTFEKMLDTGKPVSDLLTQADLAGLDAEALAAVCRAAVENNPAAVADIRAGKEKAMGALIGYVMKATRGKADAGAATALLKQLIG